jgi:hypothetical protein
MEHIRSPVLSETGPCKPPEAQWRPEGLQRMTVELPEIPIFPRNQARAQEAVVLPEASAQTCFVLPLIKIEPAIPLQ